MRACVRACVRTCVRAYVHTCTQPGELKGKWPARGLFLKVRTRSIALKQGAPGDAEKEAHSR